jgi:putative glutamine amidotransferase
MMTMRPTIGITTWTADATPGVHPRSWSAGQRYVLAVAAAGSVPQLVPLLGGDTATLRLIYEGLDGILFPGGADIDPAEYGAERLPLCGRIDADRDRTELTLARWALEERKPVIGICRGMQLVNIAAGGTLYQDLQAQRAGSMEHDPPAPEGANPHDQLVHDVEVSPGSRMESVLAERCVRVNSSHHQAVWQLAPTLLASAFAPDGVIEGVEAKGDAFTLGVQWHPEDLTESDPRMRRIFAALADEAAHWRARRA